MEKYHTESDDSKNLVSEYLDTYSIEKYDGFVKTYGKIEDKINYEILKTSFTTNVMAVLLVNQTSLNTC